METYKPLKSEQIKIETTLCMKCECQSCLMGHCPLMASQTMPLNKPPKEKWHHFDTMIQKGRKKESVLFQTNQ